MFSQCTYLEEEHIKEHQTQLQGPVMDSGTDNARTEAG